MTIETASIDAALDAQSRGDLSLLHAIVLAHPDSSDPRIEHLRGIFACATGDLATGALRLQRASVLLPGDDRIAGDLGKSLFALGRLAEASAANRHARSLAPGNADHHLFHGHIEIAKGGFEDALPAFAEAARQDPAHTEAWRLHARTAHHLQRHGEAESSYLQVLRQAPDDADARIELATLYNATGRSAEALEAIAPIGAPDPQRFLQQAIAYQALGRYEDAGSSASAGLVIAPQHPELKRLLGVALQHLNRHAEAAPMLVDAMHRRFAPGTASRLFEHLRYSRAKLSHDIEQLEYLRDAGKLPHATALLTGYRQLLASIPHGVPDTAILEIPHALLPVAYAVYNRLHHTTGAERLSGGALRERDDAERLQHDYVSNPPGILAIDGLLSDEALASLRRYCLESTVWFDFNHPNGYLGATFENGFAPPLLLQMVEELRERFPLIFRDFPLTQLWAFKYDSRLDGIELHADIAAVNLNFWITPDDANLDPGSGGLVVWDKEAPQSWSFSEFNTRGAQTRIADYLREQGSREVRIPYRCNRAVLFNSDLFHRTDSIRFREGYGNRRINITMLFGYRHQSD